MYNWQLPTFPQFTYDTDRVERWLSAFMERIDLHIAQFEKILPEDQQHILLATTVEEGVQSSSIEDEQIDRSALQSSLTENIRFGPGQHHVADIRADGVARLMKAIISDAATPLTETALRYYHELLFRGQPYLGTIGAYRSSSKPMRIVSGSANKIVVHYEAPPSNRVPVLMQQFVASLTQPLPAPLLAGIGHVHFESIHPFSDGNGRIGRALLEKQLLPIMGGRPLISISLAIRQRRDAYYAELQRAQRGLDLTDWLAYYFETLNQSVDLAGELLQFTLRKQAYFKQFGPQLDAAQTKALRRMWSAGTGGFQGGMTTKKYVRINRVSTATASRDLSRLYTLGALRREGSGRSTRYVLPDPG